jgi:hypothetical protein
VSAADGERPENPLAHAVGVLSDAQIRRLAALLRVGERRDYDTDLEDAA